MERRHDELAPRLVVEQVRAEHPLVRGGRDAVVEGLLEREGGRRMRFEALAVVVDGEAEAVALGGIGEVQGAELGGELRRVDLLQAHQVRCVRVDEIDELADRRMLAEVVADDLHAPSPCGTPRITLVDRGNLVSALT